MARLTSHNAQPLDPADIDDASNNEDVANKQEEVGVCSAHCVYEVELKTSLGEEEVLELVHSELSEMFGAFYSQIADSSEGIKSCEMIDANLEGLVMQSLEDSLIDDTDTISTGRIDLSSHISFSHLSSMLYDREGFEESLRSIAKQFATFLNGSEIGSGSASVLFYSEESLKEFVLYQIYNQYAARMLLTLYRMDPRAMIALTACPSSPEIQAVLAKFTMEKIKGQSFTDSVPQKEMTRTEYCRTVAHALTAELRDSGSNAKEIKSKLDKWMSSTPYPNTRFGEQAVREWVAASGQTFEMRGIGQRVMQEGDAQSLAAAIKSGSGIAASHREQVQAEQDADQLALENMRKEKAAKKNAAKRASNTPEQESLLASFNDQADQAEDANLSSATVVRPTNQISDEEKAEIYRDIALGSSQYRLATYHQLPPELKLLSQYFDQAWFKEFDYRVDLYRAEFGSDPTGFEMEAIVINTTEKCLAAKGSDRIVSTKGKTTRPYDLQVNAPAPSMPGGITAEMLAHIKAYHGSGHITLKTCAKDPAVAAKTMYTYFDDPHAFINFTYSDTLKKAKGITIDNEKNASVLRMDVVYPEAVEAIKEALESRGFDKSGNLVVDAVLPLVGGDGLREIKLHISHSKQTGEVTVSGSELKQASLAVYTHEGMSASFLGSQAESAIHRSENLSSSLEQPLATA